MSDAKTDFFQLLEQYATKPYLSDLRIRVHSGPEHINFEEISSLGKKVLFCTGNRAMRNYGVLDKYITAFENNGFSVCHFDNISSNPTLKQMEEGIAFAKEHKPDFIFALGGGSVMDTAKVISVGLFGNPWAFVQNPDSITESIPIIASSTTSGTGSHVTSYAVITNTDTLEKKTLKHPYLLPKYSFVDLTILPYMPKYVIACTGFDVLCHAVEVYTREECDEISKEFCVLAFRLIREHLVGSYNNDSSENKEGMAYADIAAGIALAMIGTHLPHAISHPISGRFPEVNHGQSLALIFAQCFETILAQGDENVEQKCKEISLELGGDHNLVRTIKNYIKLLDLSKTSKFTAEDCQLIFEDTMGYRKSSVDKSPVTLSAEQVKQIIVEGLMNGKHS